MPQRAVELEELLANSEPVYAIHWDSGAPGMGASTESIYRYRDGHLALVSFADEDEVYSTLQAAIDAFGIDGVNRATKYVWSSELSAE